MLTALVETGDKECVPGVAALVRSSWEDCNQARRELIAGKGKAKLDKREDDDRPRLLSKEE